MNKRLVKKVQDHGRKLNRVQLKRNYCELMDTYIFEKRVNEELLKDIQKLEGIHQEQLEDRDNTIGRTKSFNDKLANKLEDKIQEVAALEKEIDALVSERNLINKRHEQSKEVLEVMEKSLETKETHLRALGEQNSMLKDEIAKLSTPWYKRGFRK